MFVEEFYSDEQSTCPSGPITVGSVNSNSSGQFADDYWVPDTNPIPCSMTATQRHIVDNYGVSRKSIMWGDFSVEIND
jgi:hypothetical protein